MALEEPTYVSEREDHIQDIDGNTVCVTKDILQQVKSIYVDHDGYEFRITTERSFSALRRMGGC